MMKKYFDILTPHGEIRYKNIDGNIILKRIINEEEMNLPDEVNNNLLSNYEKLESTIFIEGKVSSLNKLKLRKNNLEGYKNILSEIINVKNIKIIYDPNSDNDTIEINQKKQLIVIPNVNNLFNDAIIDSYLNDFSSIDTIPFLDELILKSILNLYSTKCINRKMVMSGLNENNQNNSLNEGFTNILLNTVYPSKIIGNSPIFLSYQPVVQLCQLIDFNVLKKVYFESTNINQLKSSLLLLSKNINLNKLFLLIEKNNCICQKTNFEDITDEFAKEYIDDLYQIQNITVKYFASKIKMLIDMNKSVESISELINSYESVLLTPEKLSKFYFDYLIPHDDTVDIKLDNIKKEVGYYKNRIK